MCTSKYNVAPSFVLELISCCSKVFKDYCGVMNEESIRKNFVLVYELLEEMIVQYLYFYCISPSQNPSEFFVRFQDDGYPQWTSSDSLKSFIFNEPIIVANSASSMKMPEFSSQKTTPSNSVDKPIASSSDSKSRKNEIFVDIYEKINVTFNPSGYVLSSDIEGTIQMKSYLAGNPELKLALNEELVVGKSSASAHGAVVIDSCNFHESVKLENFERDRTMTLVPPDGEFTLMMYALFFSSFTLSIYALLNY
jgi:AP-4 complex subunit mu-1